VAFGTRMIRRTRQRAMCGSFYFPRLGPGLLALGLLLSAAYMFPATLGSWLIARSYALDVPPLTGYINDYANTLSRGTKARIERELKAFEQSDSTQIVILTIPSLQGEPLEDFSMKVAEAWKIGHKGKDNGIIVVVAKEDKKIRIEVGRGLEGRLTDLMAGRIIDLVMKPRFKRGDFDGGFIAGISSLMDGTRGEFKSSELERRPQKQRGTSPLFTLLIFGGMVLLFIGSLSRTAGGIAGAIGLPALGYLILGPALFFLIVLGVLGLFMGILLPALFGGGGLGRHGTFLPGGGFYGSSGGGGFDSGGFGGGGGGDFGGGGASGDW
jgi:uncharacterized protein